MNLAISLYHPTRWILTWPALKRGMAKTARPDFNSLFELSLQRPFIQIYFEQVRGPGSSSQVFDLHLATPTISHDNASESLKTKATSTYLQSILKHPPGGSSILASPNKNAQHCGISLGAYLELKAELDASDRELAKLRKEFSTLVTRPSESHGNHVTSPTHIDAIENPSEAQATVLYTIIGSILSVTLGRSKNGQPQSIYGNQSAIVDAITLQFPETPGLSKRTLDRKFAEARRRLAQMQQS
ncbi:hypothetical protein [Pseudomonas sp. WHRI 8519]|uniref:hypothetical protein n=1 Tax=Pseudomonas sp. WHRI 8519 TaxID=3162567 RepID=UPI0032EAEC83